MAKISHTQECDRLNSATLPEVVRSFPRKRRKTPYVVSTWLTSRNIPSAEGLVIDGFLECDLAHHQRQLLVRETARVVGSVQAHTVVVLGQLRGDIFSDGTVWLASGSEVQGNIHCARLFIEEGALFKGQIESGESVAQDDLEYS